MRKRALRITSGLGGVVAILALTPSSVFGQDGPDTQAILDTALDRAAPDVQLRFEQSLAHSPGSRASATAIAGTVPASTSADVPPPFIHPRRRQADGTRTIVNPRR